MDTKLDRHLLQLLFLGQHCDNKYIYKGESINLKNTIVDFELRNQIPVNNTFRRLAYRKESDY